VTPTSLLYTELPSATTRGLTKLDGKAQTRFLLCLDPGMRAAVVPLVTRQDKTLNASTVRNARAAVKLRFRYPRHYK